MYYVLYFPFVMITVVFMLMSTVAAHQCLNT